MIISGKTMRACCFPCRWQDEKHTNCLMLKSFLHQNVIMYAGLNVEMQRMFLRAEKRKVCWNTEEKTKMKRCSIVPLRWKKIKNEKKRLWSSRHILKKGRIIGFKWCSTKSKICLKRTCTNTVRNSGFRFLPCPPRLLYLGWPAVKEINR